MNLHDIKTTPIDVWVTAYGTRIPFIELSDQHIRNIIRIFEDDRRVIGEIRRQGLLAVRREAVRRGIIQGA